MACSVSRISRIDPILNPGTGLGHVHKFAGGNNVNQDSTHNCLFTSSCSTCEVQSDKPAYWTPQLYYEHADGTIEEVQNDGMTVYYVGRGGDSSNTVPFPAGFKMISGNSILRSYDNQNLTYLNTRPIADRVSFRCINEANNIPETHYPDQSNCVNGLRAQISFQSCWDGVNLYSPGNTHVVYLSGIDYGTCPPTHPVPIPVLYWTDRINQESGGHFVFSNGDTTGFSFHGDFLNGWDHDVQTQAVQDCLYVDNGGAVSACQSLVPTVNENFSHICPEAPAVFSEAVTGILPEKRLPGCNPITSGPGNAPQALCPINSTTPINTQPSALTTTSVLPTASTATTTKSPTHTLSLAPTSLIVTTTLRPTSFPIVNNSTFTRSTSPVGNFDTTDRATTTQFSGGIFVTISATTGFPSSISSLASTTTLVNTATLTIVQPIRETGSVTSQSFPTSFANATITTPAGNSTSTAGTILSSTSITNSTFTLASASTGTRTTLITVYSPVTVEVTSITDVTMFATPSTVVRRQAETRPLRVRGRSVVRKGS